MTEFVTVRIPERLAEEIEIFGNFTITRDGIDEG